MNLYDNPIGYPVDLSGPRPALRSDVKMFTLPDIWLSWNKPRWATMCSIVAIGGGGGGGGTQLSNTGLGGGGSSGITRLIVPAFFLPDILYVQVGIEGRRGSNGAGSSGGISYVSFGHSTTAPNVLISSATAAAAGGGAAGGLAATIATATTFSTLGSFFAIAGQAGGAPGGNQGAAGASVTAWGTIPLSGGAGGGGAGSTGGGSIAVTSGTAIDWGEGGFPLVSNTQLIATSQYNLEGFSKMRPFFQTGSAGSPVTKINPTGTIGNTDNNGKGGIGCGGGGGSGNGSASNLGGDGGIGMVLIISW